MDYDEDDDEYLKGEPDNFGGLIVIIIIGCILGYVLFRNYGYICHQ